MPNRCTKCDPRLSTKPALLGKFALLLYPIEDSKILTLKLPGMRQLDEKNEGEGVSGMLSGANLRKEWGGTDHSVEAQV